MRPNGSKLWRFRYRFAGNAKMLSFGPYPEVSLVEGRRRRDEARARLRDGCDPSAQRKAAEQRRQLESVNTFGAIAREWLDKQRASLALVTLRKTEWLLTLASALDDRPVTSVTAADVLAVLRRIEARGTHETARRVKQR
ncbi:MAG: integrase arm-type DNA-binding domain-containing protein, partial [Pseudomonadota bacterium]|nr:integrase arm-type DNA-binding domain-containing protein [Pseudomonadota bacterium]